MTAPPSLPETMRALVQEVRGSPLVLKSVPMPQPTPGAVVVRVLAALVDSKLPKILQSSEPILGFEYPLPFIPGTRAVGRVVALGPDATSLTVGQLVLLDPWVLGRDNPNNWILMGAMNGVTPGSKKLMKDNWSFAFFAEYAKTPLENTSILNEHRLCTELGYSIPELCQLAVDIVAYGGLRSIELQAGDRIIVTPATGAYNGSTVGVAVAMGASVIATGRTESALALLKKVHPGQVETVVRTGDVETDTAALKAFGPVDKMLEMGPGRAVGSTHAKSAIGALRPFGRAVIMGLGGGPMTHVEIPYMALVWNGIRIQGQVMYNLAWLKDLIKMAEAGVLKLGKERGFEVVGEFKLEELEQAWKIAAENDVFGKVVVLTPWKE
ncbi:GroES-like protein [Amniculicola lignicola CBS 123094]|uniref:GroES-like protein n=1 Tax=Amniculicola lignicola CBS 123094 TaxID=1392246 RepID=A0A6A5WIG5_9PLEO|nr:GroES-like protein [Amniculicola lignicola CBS 123094]